MRLLDSAKGFAIGIVRQALNAANIEPVMVKALLRKPPPVHGGPRARRWPWPSRRHFDKREKRAVMQLLNREIRRGGAVIYGGPETKAYCQAFANYLGGGYATAVNSGTNAVYVALSPAEDRFATLIAGLRGGVIRGCNVTLPFKEAALAKLKPYDRGKRTRFRPNDRLLAFLDAL